MSLTVELVETPEQAEALRRLRNQCRVFMTNDTRRVGKARQRRFYRAQIAPGTVRAFLARGEDGQPVAYGLLRAAEGFWWLSCGVAAHARGRGAGTALVRLVTAAGLNTGRPVRLEVWADNDRAVHVYEKAGYVAEAQAERDGRPLKVMVAR